MRTWLAPYQMRSAATLEEALTTLSREPGRWRPFAGGTDLMVLLEAGRLPHQHFLDIWPLRELQGITASADVVDIGALATYTDLLQDAVVAAEFPLVCDAARQTGAVAIQNRGTVGGNIANASPAADLPPALLVYDAEVELASVRGRRRIPYERFHTGYKQMELAPDELIVRVSMRRGRRSWRQTYRKVGTRRAQAISKICFAAAADVQDGVVRDVRIALGSVAPTVIRARGAEAALHGQPLADGVRRGAAAALEADVAPIDDVRSTAAYRRLVARNLLEEFLA
ncbi:MAG TPA: xanthine dehydrogenase family protein subunit M [Vicinamibacterales bacterium]|nr:xanthine dehydrogenase family protein subunit M [Vicinamibacterales bacterium]